MSGKEDVLKRQIMDAINSNPSVKKKIEALKSGKLGNILQCYKESAEEYGVGNDEIILSKIWKNPEETRRILKSWASSDIWHSIIKKTGKRPDDYEFEIKFHQILDE